MSHGITAKDSMFSVRETPWHRLGIVLKKAPSSVQDALKKSGLDWQVIQKPLYVPGPTKKDRPELVDGFLANVRRDTGDVLGVVTDRYTPVQNHAALSFVDNLLGTSLTFETAGSLNAGKRVWVLARVPGHITVGGDPVQEYLLFANRHDGKGSVQVLLTKVRVVCANTWAFALDGADAERIYTVRHVGDVTQGIHDARAVMGMHVQYSKQFVKLGNRLASQRMTDRKLDQVLKELWPDETLAGGGSRSRAKSRDAVITLFKDGPTVGNAPGSKWCALNAITEHLDYGRRVKSPEGLFIRAFGDHDGMKAKASELVAAA